MGEFANANRQGEGEDFLSARLNEFAPRLTDPQKALYLSAIGLLRAQNANSVSLFGRIGYVKNTISMLDQAKKLSGGQIFVVNWISGVVRSELPGFLLSEAGRTRRLEVVRGEHRQGPRRLCFAKIRRQVPLEVERNRVTLAQA
jgi:hypothetical protein